MINKNQIYNLAKVYGITFALKASIFRLFSREKYIKLIYNKIYNEFGNYIINNEIIPSDESKKNVWVFWWQGEKNVLI